MEKIAGSGKTAIRNVPEPPGGIGAWPRAGASGHPILFSIGAERVREMGVRKSDTAAVLIDPQNDEVM
jgi:hypothetical protein